MAAASEARLRALEAKLSSVRRTAREIGVSGDMVWRWRHARASFTDEQLSRLEHFLYATLANIELLALRGGRKGAA